MWIFESKEMFSRSHFPEYRVCTDESRLKSFLLIHYFIVSPTSVLLNGNIISIKWLENLIFTLVKHRFFSKWDSIYEHKNVLFGGGEVTVVFVVF